jgi:hypothetical protein
MSAKRLMPRLTRTSALLLAASALIAAGCGGGGGGSGGGGETEQAPSTGSTGGGGSSGSPFIPTGNGIDGQTAFSQTVYPLLTQYCASCHAGGGPGFPHIAHPDLGTAYRAVIDNQKANFATPAASRLVQRLSADQHHCWSTCAADGMTMEQAITEWATLIGFATGSGSGGGSTGTGGTTVSGVASSYTNGLANAALAANQRDESNVIALWTFQEEQGNTAMDISGIPPAMDLTLTGTAWVPGGGLEIVSGRALASATTSQKLFDRIASGRGSQEYSIEAWVIPANTDQEGPARIITYAADTNNRNFMLGQVKYTYQARNRSMAPGVSLNGNPALQTADADEDLQASLQHVVVTYDQTNGRRIYVNGFWTEDADETPPAPLLNWNPSYRFALGNEATGSRLWLGQFRLVAIYDRAMTEEQIAQNYLAGGTEKYVLRFGLDDYLSPGDYIEFTVSDLDAYSYLFCFPTIQTSMPNGFAIQGLKVTVNGAPPVASQSFRNVSAAVTQSRQVLSGLCSVVPKDLGGTLDQFSIWFDIIAATNVFVPEPPPTVMPDNSVLPPLPDVGIRDFDRINNTLAELTGVDPNDPDVLSTFEEVRQQLPMDPDVRSFVSAMQVGIAKLALEYCNELVDSPALRAAFFPGFNFNRDAVSAFAAQADRDLISNALYNRGVGSSLANQPSQADISTAVNELIDELILGCTPATCPAERTETVVKSTCTAVLGSAAVHLQ